MHKMESS